MYAVAPAYPNNTLEWYAPQVFHGIRTDVTVPASSSVLLKFSGANPLSL